MFRVHYTATGEHAGQFMSPPMSFTEAKALQQELETDPEVVNIHIEEA